MSLSSSSASAIPASWTAAGSPPQGQGVVSGGRRRHPPGVLDELRRYVAALDERADADVANALREGRERLDLYVPRDDFDAGLLGWRTVAEWRAYAGRVVAKSTLPVTCKPVLIKRA